MMKTLFINISGMGNLARRISLHRIVEKEKPDIFLVEETMSKWDIIIGNLKKLFKYWDFQWVDATGMSRGLIMIQ